MPRTTRPPLDRDEADAFRKQQTAFAVLTLFVLALLLLLHTLFASLLGEPSTRVIALLGLAFALKFAELLWLQGESRGITERTAKLETGLSIFGLFVLSGLLAYLTNRDDAPYFVLLAIPVLQCAYHFGLLPTVLTIAAADGMIFFWLGHYFVLHPPPLAGEYLEAGMLSIVFALMGLLVWFLVHQLRQQQTRLAANMLELEAARERLIREEKLAAVGRLASGIAHEIRNPVAMISSSLATAADSRLAETDREEMFRIASREANRLGRLTQDFLTYARPSAPRRSTVLLRDLLSYTADSVKAYAAGRSVAVTWSCPEKVTVEADAAQVQGALLNLAMNGIDATPEGGLVELKAAAKASELRIEVQNSGSPIAEADQPRIFEPFFSTKAAGTGLGLAIARGVARAHGGDLWLSCNLPGRVAFTLTLEAYAAQSAMKEA